MRQNELRKRLAKYMKLKRGDMTFRDFAKKYRLSFATVSRIEKLEQNVTIDTLNDLCKTFKCDVSDLFPK